MDSTSRKIIRQNMRIIKSLDLDRIKPFLEKSKIFTRSMLSDIYDDDCKCDLVSELPTRGPSAFLNFLKVLENSGYMEQAKILKTVPQSKTKKKVTFYPMKSKPLGYCLIINNIDFDHHDKRYGSDVDARVLKEFFEKLDFNVQEETNLRGKDIQICLNKLSKDPVLKTIDCFFVIILSHGERGDIIFGTDSFELTKSNIYNTFNNINCPFLRQKPKIFLFQACRGKKEDPGVESTDSTDSIDNQISYTNKPATESVDFKTNEKNTLITESTDSTCTKKIPTVSDIFIVHSSLPNHKAYRDWDLGSWLIQDLISVFSDNYLEQDFEAMLKIVYEKCEKRLSAKGRNKQVPHSENLGFKAYLHLCRNEEYEGCEASSRHYIEKDF